MPEAQKAKISAALKGRPITPEQRSHRAKGAKTRRALKALEPAERYVYVACGNGETKVGISDDPFSRLYGLGPGMRLVHAEPGDIFIERAAHEILGVALKRGREWFRGEMLHEEAIALFQHARRKAAEPLTVRPREHSLAVKLLAEALAAS